METLSVLTKRCDPRRFRWVLHILRLLSLDWAGFLQVFGCGTILTGFVGSVDPASLDPRHYGTPWHNMAKYVLKSFNTTEYVPK